MEEEGGIVQGGADRDDYSFEDSEQFEDDSICSVGTDEGGMRSGDWKGWVEEETVGGYGPSTSGVGGGGRSGGVQGGANVDSSLVGRAPSANSTLTLTPSMGRSAAAAAAAVAADGVKKEAVVDNVPTLFNTAAKACARNLTFSKLEECYNKAMLYRYNFPFGDFGDGMMSRLHLLEGTGHHNIPEKIFLAIIRYCFPESEDDIRMYSCLANGGSDEFTRGESVYLSGCVRDAKQIGYNICATVYGLPYAENIPEPDQFETEMVGHEGEARRKVRGGMKHGVIIHPSTPSFKTTINVDRCRIIECRCNCEMRGWCEHVVALSLYRINQKEEVAYRSTIWDQINELNLNETKKLVQNLINQCPETNVEMAQKLIDSLKDPRSELFKSLGAPDPTDGGNEIFARWSIDDTLLHERISRTLYRFCQPSPTVHCDVQSLNTTPPAIASEWALRLLPLKTKRPEGIWNLLNIARTMFKKGDENATSLLHAITDEILANTQIVIWWLICSLQQSGRWIHSVDRKTNPPITANYEVPQLGAAEMCEEMVSLWRVAALNPALNTDLKKELASCLQRYHMTAVERMWLVMESMGGVKGGKKIETHHNMISTLIGSTLNGDRASLSTATARFTLDSFPGFYPALQACHLNLSRGDLGVPDPEVVFPFEESPFIPKIDGGLRRPYTVAATSALMFGGYGMMENCGSSSKKKKSKKKSRKAAALKKSSRHKLLEDMEAFECEELESAESGQESDIAGPSHGGKKKGRRMGCFPTDDVHLLFAEAHQLLDGVELKLARCESLLSHGFTTIAASRAAEIVWTMRGGLPKLVWSSDMLQEIEPIVEAAPLPTIPPTPTIPIPPFKNHTANRARHPSQYYNTAPLHMAYPTDRLPLPPPGKKRFGRTVAKPDNSQPLPPLPIQLPDPRVHSISQLTCNTLQRALFLARQLHPSHPSTRHSVFRLLIDVLTAPKGAMSTNHLQVKLFHLESEVLSLLNTMPIDSEELEVIRSCASDLARWDLSPTGKIEMDERGVPPVALVTFIFQSIVIKDNILVREEDEMLAVAASLSVLGSRHNYPIDTFPMLGECLRRQKGELAMSLLKRYKDDSQKIGLIMDRILDPSLHRMYKYHKSNGIYFLDGDAIYGAILAKGERPSLAAQIPSLKKKIEKEWKKEEEEETKEDGVSSRRSSIQQSMDSEGSGGRGEGLNDDSEESGGNDDGNRSSISTRRSSDEGNESSSNSTGPHFNIDTRMESNESGGSGQKGSAPFNGSSSYQVETRFPNRRMRQNGPCEAHAHYMMDFAKRIQTEAGGGDQNSVVFRHAAPNNPGPHRKLLMCSFLTSLYSLGLSNKASFSWASRTYSNHGSWIKELALEIGSPALDVIRTTWHAHFTPSETSAIAQSAGQSRDQNSVDSGAFLALSVLLQCQSLSPSEAHRALIQCRDQGSLCLEQAISAVEESSSRGEVSAEILFSASRLWADMSLETDPSHPLPSISFNPSIHSIPQPASNPHPNPAMMPSNAPYPPPPSHLSYNPYYAAANALQLQQRLQQLQQQQQMAAAAAAGQPQQQDQQQQQQQAPPPGVGRRDEDGNSASSSSSGSVTHYPHAQSRRPSQRPHPHPPPPSQRPLHSSNSAPNLNPAGGLNAGLHFTPALTKHDPRIERMARAHRLGLRGMDTIASRNDMRNASYSQHHDFKDDILSMYRLSCRLDNVFSGSFFVLSFVDSCTRNLFSPHTLTFLLFELLNRFSVSPYVNTRLASVSTNRPPSGFGQGQFRSAALAAGWQPPLADLFDRTLEMAHAAISNKMVMTGNRMMNQVDCDEIVEMVQLMQRLLTSPYIMGWPIFEKLLSFTLHFKQTSKELATQIRAIRQGIRM